MTTEPERKGDAWLTPREHARLTHEYRRRSRRELGREDAIQDWFGEEAELEMAMHHAPTRAIGNVLDAVFADLDLADKAILRELLHRWDELLGSDIARVTTPQSLRDKTLFIEVSDPVWRFRLQNVQRDILKRLQAVAPAAIRSIRLVPGGRAATRP